MTAQTSELAPDGQVYQCAVCGKRSRDRYGEQAIDRGWDESCFLNAVPVDAATLRQAWLRGPMGDREGV